MYFREESFLTFQWDLGDETVSEEREFYHSFADDGTYTVTLTVSDDEGRAGELEVDITVLNVEPTVQINSPYGGEVGSTIWLSAQANDPGDDALTLEWSFGDGQFAFGEIVTHEYLYPGLFEVTLTVRDGDGGETVVKSIAVVREVIDLDPTTDENIAEPDEEPDTADGEDGSVNQDDVEQQDDGQGTSLPTVVWRRPPSSYWDVVTLTVDHGDSSDDLSSERAATHSSSIFGALLVIGQCIALLAGTFVWVRSRKLR
jgi:PKD repeat protein